MNHYLLMADLVVRKEMKGYDTVAILPPFKKIIIDEGAPPRSSGNGKSGLHNFKIEDNKTIGKVDQSKG